MKDNQVSAGRLSTGGTREVSSVPSWAASSDVIVVGGGAAGFAAAIEAASQGASVVILEKNLQPGGTTAMAIGSVAGAGTSIQRRSRIDDSPGAYLENLAEVAPQFESKNNPVLRKLFAFEGANTIEWLTKLGVTLYGPYPDTHNRVPRLHVIVPGMKACVKKLEKAARQRGCRVVAGHEVKELVQDETGRVVGVVSLEKVSQNLKRFRANRGVILCCGDYSGNVDLKRQFLPPGVAEIEAINATATGDGHRLGINVGAEIANMDLIYGPELRLIPDDRRTLRDRLPDSSLLSKMMAKVPWIHKIVLTRVAKEMLVSWQHPEDAIFNKGAILMNTSGKRFTDETQGPRREIDVARQPGMIAFLVFDHGVAQQFSAWPNFMSTAPGIAYAYLQDYRRFRPDIFFEARSWEDLATRFSVPKEVFRETMDDYNRVVEGKHKDPWGRQVFGDPLAEPPFYMLGPVKAYVPTTKGGLRVNSDFQVISRNGKEIPGLYAAGQTGVGGLILSSHGTGLAWAFTSGRLAGRQAADRGSSG